MSQETFPTLIQSIIQRSATRRARTTAKALESYNSSLTDLVATAESLLAEAKEKEDVDFKKKVARLVELLEEREKLVGRCCEILEEVEGKIEGVRRGVEEEGGEK